MAKHVEGIEKASGDRRSVSFRNTHRYALEPRVLLDAAAAEILLDTAVTDEPTDTSTTDATGELADALATLEPEVTEVAFVDSSLEDAQALADSLRQEGRAVFIIEQGDGLAQMRDALAGFDNLSAVHILSHGQDGQVLLGGLALDSATATARESDLAAIGAALSTDGDLLLYGCDVADSTAGQALVDQLAALTGASVAASDDTTGVSGDWELEYQAGEVNAAVPDVLKDYLGDLELEGLSAGNETGGASDQLGWSMDGSGEWVVSGGWNNGEARVWQVEGATRNEQVLTPPGGAGTSFGRGVAIYGDELVVAAPDAGTDGMLYVYTLDTVTDTWNLAQSIDVSIGGTNIGPWTTYSNGGQYLDISNGRIVVGAPNEDSGSGRIAWFVDTSASGDWSTYKSGQMDEPAGFNDDSQPRFGASVALAGDNLAVGAPEADLNGTGLWGSNGGNHGSVFIYSWTQASADNGNGPATSTTLHLRGQDDVDGINGGSGVDNARFGAAISMELYEGKYTLAVGAPTEGGTGELYVYQSTSTDITTFQGASNIYDQTTGGGADRYGSSVAVNQGRVLVGAGSGITLSNTDVAVWYYDSPSNTWSGLDTNNPGAAGINVLTFTSSQLGVSGADKAGQSLAFLQGSMAVIGAHLDDDGGTDAGQAIFRILRTPFAVADNYAISEDAASASYDIINNDFLGTETLASVTFQIVSQAGFGTATWNGSTLNYDPGQLFQYLAAGESTEVTIVYRLTDNSNNWFSSTAAITFTITGANDAVQDGIGMSDVAVPQANDPVNTSQGKAPDPTVGSIAIRDNVFSDVDVTDDLTYSLVGITQISGAASSNPGVSISNTGFRTGTLNYDLTGVDPYTQFRITIRATDPSGTTRDTSFVLTVARVNETPELSSNISNYNATEDSVFQQDISTFFTDPDFSWVDPDPNDSLDFSENLTFSITSQTGPGNDWLTISSSGSITGVPVNDNVGTHTVTVRATDIFGNYVEDTFDVTVGNTNDAPAQTQSIDRVVAESGTGASVFSFDVTAVNAENPDGPFFQDFDPTGDTITYTAELLDGTPITSSTAGSGTGSWIRFDGTTFTGSPTDPLGTVFTVRLTATDNNGASSSALFEVGVFPPPGDSGGVTDGGITEGGQLGWSSAVSNNGTWAVYGAPGANGGNGQIQIFENVAGTWTFHSSFTTTAAGARLGTSVDINDAGDRIVVGAPMENGQRGAVYYFERGGTTWAAGATAKTTATDAAVGDRFGSAVAINEAGNFVLVGAPLDDNARGSNAGASYMFGWGTASTTEASLNKRLPTLDAGESSAAGDMYGHSVAFDQNMLVVGAVRDDHSGATDAGSVYVYSTDNSSYTKLTKSSDVADADYFGWSVDVDSFSARAGVILAVGAYGDDSNGSNAGAVYIFRSSTMTSDNTDGDGALNSLVYQSTIYAYDAAPFQGFGAAVSVDVEGDVESNGIRMAIGGDINAGNSGGIYSYRYWSGYGWVGQRFNANNSGFTTTAEGNQMGFSVDVAGQEIIGGAPRADRSGSASAGLVYGFTLTTSSAVNVSPLSDASLVKMLFNPGPLLLEGAQRDVSTLVLLDREKEEWKLSSTGGSTLPASLFGAPVRTDGVSSSQPDFADMLLFELRTLDQLVAADVNECGEADDCRETEAEAEADQGEQEAEARKDATGFQEQLESQGKHTEVQARALMARLADLVA